MFIRKCTVSSRDICFKNDRTRQLAEESAKQGEIRKLCKRPIRDDQILLQLGMYRILDTDTIAIIDLDQRKRVENICVIPLCFDRTLDDYHYLYSILEQREHNHRWAVALHLRGEDEETMEAYKTIVERFVNTNSAKGASFLLCCGFNAYSVKRVKRPCIRMGRKTWTYDMKAFLWNNGTSDNKSEVNV